MGTPSNYRNSHISKRATNDKQQETAQRALRSEKKNVFEKLGLTGKDFIRQ